MNLEELLQRLTQRISEAGEDTGKVELPPDAFVLSDDEGRNLLMRAAAEGELGLVRFLLSRNPETAAESNRQEQEHSVDPMKMIEELERSLGDVSTIGAGIDATDYHGRTALLHAAAGGHGEIVSLLLEAGADPDIKDFSGRSYRELLEAAGGSAGAQSSVHTGGEELEAKRRELSRIYTKRVHEELHYDLKSYRKELEDLDEVNAEISLNECRQRKAGGQSAEGSATEQCIEEIENERFDHGAVDWDRVDVAAVTCRILEQKLMRGISLAGIALPFFVELLVRAARENENWAPAILSKFEFDVHHSTMMDSPWAPRVLWNGCVLIRNGHRVMGLSYRHTMFLSQEEREEFCEDIRKLGDQVWMISSKGREIRQIDDPADANLHGNNLIGLRDVEEIEGKGTSLLSGVFLGKAAAGNYDARGGVAFRLFKEGLHIYTIERESDEFDFAIDYLAVYNENTGPVPISDVMCPRDRSSRWEQNSERRAAEMKKHEHDQRQFLHEIISTVFLNSWEEYKDASAAFEEAESRKVSLYGKRSLYYLLLGEVLSGTRSLLNKLFDWGVPGIFTDSEALVHGYMGSYEYAAGDDTEGKPIHLSLGVNSVESADEYDRLIEEIFEKEEIDRLFEEYGGHSSLKEAVERGKVFAELHIIKDSRSPGDWQPLTEENIEQFKRRLLEITEGQMEGDWDECQELLMDEFSYLLLRLRFGLKHREPIDLKEMGIRLSQILVDADEEKRVLSSCLNIDIPSMGLEQTFCNGDLDSGNMRGEV